MHLPSIVRCFSYFGLYKSGRAPNSIIQTIAMKFECVYYTHRAAYFIDPLTAIRKKKFYFYLFAGTKVDVNSFVTFSVISRQCKCFPSMASQLT